jgi:hypothetical protein
MPPLNSARDGFPPQEIQQQRQIPLLSTFDVPTSRNC